MWLIREWVDSPQDPAHIHCTKSLPEPIWASSSDEYSLWSWMSKTCFPAARIDFRKSSFASIWKAAANCVIVSTVGDGPILLPGVRDRSSATTYGWEILALFASSRVDQPRSVRIETRVFAKCSASKTNRSLLSSCVARSMALITIVLSRWIRKLTSGSHNGHGLLGIGQCSFSLSVRDGSPCFF